jgi:MFS family permease
VPANLPAVETSAAEALPSSVRRNSLLTVALGNFMVQMAMMPVSTILPTVATEFGIQLDVASWVMSAYLLLLTGWLLTAGRLGDQFGHRRVYVAGIALYMVAGTACGLAQSPLQLIALRAVQGIGGALMLGNGLAIVVNSFPARQHGRSIGIAMMAASLGSTIGVAIGGVALEYLSWRWMFFVIAPLGAIALVAALGLRGVTTPRKAHRVDWQGALLLFLMLTAVTLSMTHLHDGEESFEAGWPYHTAMQVLALVLLGAFVWVERRAAEPMVLFQYFRYGRFTFPLLAHGVLHMVMMGTIFLAPFVIERGTLLSAAMTAAFLVTRQLVTVGMAPLSGWLYDRTRSPLMAPLAMAGIAACLLPRPAGGPPGLRDVRHHRHPAERFRRLVHDAKQHGADVGAAGRQEGLRVGHAGDRAPDGARSRRANRERGDEHGSIGGRAACGHGGRVPDRLPARRVADGGLLHRRGSRVAGRLAGARRLGQQRRHERHDRTGCTSGAAFGRLVGALAPVPQECITRSARRALACSAWGPPRPSA